MLSNSIINTYSNWQNSKDSQNSFKKPTITIPTPKYSNTPLGIGMQNSSNKTTPYLSNTNNANALYSKPAVMSIVPMYGNYVIIDSDQSDSVNAEFDSDSDSEKGDVGIDIIEIEEINIPKQDKDISPYMNLDNYKLKDPVIQFYFGSITVIGLFILFRLMSKTK